MRALAVHGLRVRRGGRRVLDDVAVELSAGRIAGLVGPSGSGKTTLMRAIAGVQRTDAGEGHGAGVAGRLAGDARARGLPDPGPRDLSRPEVAENLRFFARLAGAGSKAVAEAVARVRLEGCETRLAGRLSGGQRARVALACALMGDPPLLVLDEPTVGVDPVLRDELWSLFRRLAAGGAALLVSSHVMEEADRCDEIVLLRDGRVLSRGTPAELRARTGAPTVEAAFLTLVAA